MLQFATAEHQAEHDAGETAECEVCLSLSGPAPLSEATVHAPAVYRPIATLVAATPAPAIGVARGYESRAPPAI